jgi:adenosylhomocysteine nucleosidase
MNNVLVLSAFPEEQSLYFSKLTILRKEKIGFVDVSMCEYNNISIYFATTGMGTINASLVLACLSSSLKFDAVFFSGTSGGIDKRLKIGDVVVASDTFDADILSIHDEVIGTPFESALTNPNNSKKTPKSFKASPTLLEYSDGSNHKFSIFKGTVATSNHFPTPSFLFDKIKEKNAMVIDMESTAIYQFSWLAKLPCLVIRGVSNCIDNQGNDDQVDQSDISSSDNAAILVMDCLKRLSLSSTHRQIRAKL